MTGEIPLPRSLPSDVFALNARESRLHAAFKELCPRLAEWYFGALYVLRSEENPDRISQSAQSIREIMEKFPECAGRSVPNLQGEAVQLLKVTIEKIRVLGAKEPQEIGVEAKKVCGELEVKFLEYERINQTRSEQLIEMMRDFDPAKRPMSGIHEQKTRQEWNRLKRFFTEVAHHRATPDEEGFRVEIGLFEDMAGAFLSPSTTDEIAELKALIAEAERGH